LQPDIAAKATELKEANNAYLNAKCGGSPSKQQAAAQATRDARRAELGSLIATSVGQLPEVQGALDAATDAGEAASRVTADANATSQERAAAQAKFEIARTYLNEVAKAARDRIEAKLQSEVGVTLAATAESCPEKAKKAERKRPSKPSLVSSERRKSPSPGPAPQGPAPAIGVGVSPGGFGIGIGGVGVTIRH
jgi:hypothetical protein